MNFFNFQELYFWVYMVYIISVNQTFEASEGLWEQEEKMKSSPNQNVFN